MGPESINLACFLVKSEAITVNPQLFETQYPGAVSLNFRNAVGSTERKRRIVAEFYEAGLKRVSGDIDGLLALQDPFGSDLFFWSFAQRMRLPIAIVSQQRDSVRIISQSRQRFDRATNLALLLPTLGIDSGPQVAVGHYRKLLEGSRPTIQAIITLWDYENRQSAATKALLPKSEGKPNVECLTNLEQVINNLRLKEPDNQKAKQWLENSVV